MSESLPQTSLPSKRAARGEDGGRARERLLEAGTRLFSERGYAATSVGAICERAGVGKPALYWHFESKEGLLAAVLDALVSRWIEGIERLTAVAPPGPEGWLRTMLAGMRRLVIEEPQLLRLPVVAALEQGGDSSRIRAAVIEIWDRTGDAIARGAAAATGRPAEAFTSTAFVAIGLHQAAAIRFAIDGDQDRLARNLEELERSLRALLQGDLE